MGCIEKEPDPKTVKPNMKNSEHYLYLTDSELYEFGNSAGVIARMNKGKFKGAKAIKQDKIRMKIFELAGVFRQ